MKYGGLLGGGWPQMAAFGRFFLHAAICRNMLDTSGLRRPTLSEAATIAARHQNSPENAGEKDPLRGRSGESARIRGKLTENGPFTRPLPPTGNLSEIAFVTAPSRPDVGQPIRYGSLTVPRDVRAVDIG